MDDAPPEPPRRQLRLLAWGGVLAAVGLLLAGTVASAGRGDIWWSAEGIVFLAGVALIVLGAAGILRAWWESTHPHAQRPRRRRTPRT